MSVVFDWISEFRRWEDCLYGGNNCCRWHVAVVHSSPIQLPMIQLRSSESSIANGSARNETEPHGPRRRMTLCFTPSLKTSWIGCRWGLGFRSHSLFNFISNSDSDSVSSGLQEDFSNRPVFGRLLATYRPLSFRSSC